jgi:hypothetical protein
MAHAIGGAAASIRRSCRSVAMGRPSPTWSSAGPAWRRPHREAAGREDALETWVKVQGFPPVGEGLSLAWV